MQKKNQNSMTTSQHINGFKAFASPLFALALTVAVSAQVSRPQRPSPIEVDTTSGSIRGRVLMPEGSPFNGTARLTLQAMNGGQVVIFTDYQGQFNFGEVSSGNYTLEVDGDRQIFTPVSQGVQVFRGAPTVVNISLKYKPGAERAAGGGSVVSVAELDKSIPEKARKEFRRGSEAAQANKNAEAIEHFRKAVEIYPDFMMAHNDLGLQLIVAARLDEAAEQLRLAIKLDPKAFNPQLNLGIVLMRQQQFSEAAGVLATAVSLNPQSPAARLYAGQAYGALGNSDRAEQQLRSAFELGGTDYAVALFYLGNVYMNRGERAKAVKSFEAYLVAAPNAANAGDVRKLVGALR